MQTRTEQDSMGKLNVPIDALYQAQTQRAVQNFRISGQTLPVDFIQALLQIKKAAAETNLQLGLVDADISTAICQAADQQLSELAKPQPSLRHYPIDVFQTGSGTSTNMNVNEVLATLASKALGKNISPNDHVNLGQSSNDTIPSAIHISAALAVQQQLLPSLQQLQQQLVEKAQQIGHLVKTGRTHLMDAMPVNFSQILGGWQAQLHQAEQQLKQQLTLLQALAQGGTAVGTGINADPAFAATFCKQLSHNTGLAFSPAANFFAAIGSQDTAVSVSGALKTLAVCLMKMSNDLRWMNSGPLAGLGEISLPALQPGSSIMPGKVNPVIPEAVAMVCAQVIGNDCCITVAGQSGNFELNVMLPLIAQNLLHSIRLLANGCTALSEQAIKDFTVQEDNISKPLALNPILVTALNPLIGYAKAAEIAKQANQQQRPVLDVALEHTSYSRKELMSLLDPAKLCQGGNSA